MGVAHSGDAGARRQGWRLITGSLNPLGELGGRDPIDVIIEQCKQLDVLDVELVTVFPQGAAGSRQRRTLRPAASTNHTRLHEDTPGTA